MHLPSFVGVLPLLAAVCSALPGPSLHARDTGNTDWSVAIVESTMARHTPKDLGPWQYFTGLYLQGQYKVYKRTGDERYLTYIKEWADQFVDDNGYVNNTFNSLDSMQAGNIFVLLHDETQDKKYETAATQIRERLNTYPRTTDGAFWHSTELTYQLWADGAFMINPFIMQYGKAFDDKEYADDETTKQIILYGKHLQVENGLLQHAYDESREEPWANPETGRSAEQWCRAIGWYGLVMNDILEDLPKDHPNRQHLIDNLKKFAEGVERYQDAKTGRWWQVVNKGDVDDNWTETSCSAMFTDALSRGMAHGYLDKKYQSVVSKGLNGVLERVQNNTEGYTDVLEICIGTGVGDLQFYLDRPRETNDLHGLGAVLLMNERVTYGSDS